jgi:hypothetical protein
MAIINQTGPRTLGTSSLQRDIQAWEELTYDYRFNSAVELPCNCGAATCRLLVNWPEPVDQEERLARDADSSCDDANMADERGSEFVGLPQNV